MQYVDTFEHMLHFQKTGLLLYKLYYLDGHFSFIIYLVVFKGSTSVKGYFPDATWYDGLDGSILQTSGGGGQYHTLSAPWDKINFHFRGGHIILTQQPNITTYYR